MGYEIVWKHEQKDRLLREIGIVCAGSPDIQDKTDFFFNRFLADLQLHPLEWPSSELLPSEHEWSLSRISVRYRVHPDSQTIEILTVAAHRSTFLSP